MFWSNLRIFQAICTHLSIIRSFSKTPFFVSVSAETINQNSGFGRTLARKIVLRTKTLWTNCAKSRSRCPETKKGVFEKLLIIERWVQIAVSSISRNVSHATKSCPVKIVVFQYNFYRKTFFFWFLIFRQENIL